MTEHTTQPDNRTVGPVIYGAVAVGLIIIVALLWLLFIRRDRPAPVPSAASPAAPRVATPAAVIEFSNYLRDNRAEEAMAEDHAYTSGGLRRLAAALESVSERDGVRTADIERGLAQLRQQADSIQADPHATTHAADIRAAFTTAADLMAALQQQRYPGLDAQVAQARRAAETIDPARLTLAQKLQVGTFFAQASEVLRAMAQAGN